MTNLNDAARLAIGWSTQSRCCPQIARALQNLIYWPATKLEALLCEMGNITSSTDVCKIEWQLSATSKNYSAIDKPIQ
ncbi:MAG: hypothetical protein EAZ25_05985 [Oscillatoriales cyanobacterium]|nr:MAG: hypothetical protein EAZ25_05985 [Oscillatoriales cyanobacterium]